MVQASDRIELPETHEGSGSSIPAEWAPALVVLLWKRDRKTFGALVGEVLAGFTYGARKPRAAAEPDQLES